MRDAARLLRAVAAVSLDVAALLATDALGAGAFVSKADGVVPAARAR